MGSDPKERELKEVATNLGWCVKATEHPDDILAAYLGRDVSSYSITLWVEGKPENKSVSSTYDLRVTCLVSFYVPLTRPFKSLKRVLNPHATVDG